jgi:AhpD family alkylhydroperoxidase
MSQNYPEIVAHLASTMRTMHKEIPGPMRAFASLADSAKTDGALDAKTKELIACAISIALRCDGCIGFHTRGALKAGATRAEFMEMIGVAVMMGGGPSTVFGAFAIDALDQFSTTT